MATNNLATAAAPPEPLEVRLAGDVYKMRPMTVSDRAELDRHLQHRVIQLARGSLTDDMRQDERDEIMDAAFRRAEKTSMSSEQGVSLMTTSLPLLSRMIWMMLRDFHPDMTPESVEKLLIDPVTIEEFMDAVDLVNGERDGQKKTKSTKRKRSKRKTKARKSKSR